MRLLHQGCGAITNAPVLPSHFWLFIVLRLSGVQQKNKHSAVFFPTLATEPNQADSPWLAVVPLLWETVLFLLLSTVSRKILICGEELDPLYVTESSSLLLSALQKNNKPSYQLKRISVIALVLRSKRSSLGSKTI